VVTAGDDDCIDFTLSDGIDRGIGQVELIAKFGTGLPQSLQFCLQFGAGWFSWLTRHDFENPRPESCLPGPQEDDCCWYAKR
jgi:hypothetical protein